MIDRDVGHSRSPAIQDELQSTSIDALEDRLSTGMRYICRSIEEAIGPTGRFPERKLGQFAILDRRHKESSKVSVPWSSPFDIETDLVEFLEGFQCEVVVRAINKFDLRNFRMITASNIIEPDEVFQDIQNEWTQLKDAVTTCVLSDTQFVRKAVTCAEVRQPFAFERVHILIFTDSSPRAQLSFHDGNAVRYPCSKREEADPCGTHQVHGR
jgi:hypothetical protein